MSPASVEVRHGIGWVSGHLHHAGDVYGPESDRVILDVAVPLARGLVREGLAERYFFVRYGGEEGAHVRLRLRGAVRLLAPRLDDVLRARLTSSGIESDIGPVELRRVPYVPELERYGGAAGVEVAEGLFYTSSEAVADLLGAPDGCDPSARSGSAVLAMAVLLHGMLEGAGHSAAFLPLYQGRYLHGFLPDEDAAQEWRASFDAAFERQKTVLEAFVAETWRRLDVGEGLSPALDRYRDGVAWARRALVELLEKDALDHAPGGASDGRTALARLAASHLHMTNNRLGIPTHEETYVAHLLARALEPPVGVHLETVEVAR